MQHAFRIAAAADIDPQGGVAVTREIGMGQRVERCRAVVLAVGDVFDDRGNRIGLGVLGQPQPGGEARPVGERNAEVQDLAYLVGELMARGHRVSLDGRELRVSSIAGSGPPDGDPDPLNPALRLTRA